MKIVEDRYEIIENTNPREYRVIEGRNTDTSNGVMKFISKRNRKKKK